MAPIPNRYRLMIVPAALAVACLARLPLTGPGRLPAADGAAPQPAPPTVTVSPDVPSDIPGGAPTASLHAAAVFAWQEFIALNWPAKAGVRDTPDPAVPFGSPAPGPLVWHTYRAKNEIFPSANSATVPPHGYDPGGKDFGYDTPPYYAYDGGLVPPGPGQPPVEQPAWINLDEVSQIGLDSMFAGVAPGGATPSNSNPQLIRFMAKANRTEYVYVASNSYWYGGTAPGGNGKPPVVSPRQQAQENFTRAVLTGKFPPAQPYLSLPAGTIETKAAFRPLTDQERRSNRFYTTRVRYYEAGRDGGPVYHEAEWGLIALHIIQKTPTAPAFVYATFEQADNLLTTVDGRTVPVEDVDGTVVHPAATPTSPALIYKDDPNDPEVRIAPGQTFGDPHGSPRLFYRNLPAPTGVPLGPVAGGAICVNQRDRAIPPPVVAVNRAAHKAIAAYSAAKGVAHPPWLYYKLVNVQAYPFDKTEVVSDPNSPRNAATFHLANVVVETNYTLQNFSGRIASNNAPTDYAKAGQQPFRNTYILDGGRLKASYNMGGCMGCHANAQSGEGSDFSFILGDRPATRPETPPQLLDTKVHSERQRRLSNLSPPE